MKKDEYLKEMEKLLEDTNTYSLLNNDPTNKFEKMANNLITKLQNESIISEGMGKNLRSYNSVTPKLYGLRKTHKKECTMRPVVSSIGSPCYKLAKFIHLLLTRTISNKFVFSIKNSLAEHHFKTGHIFKFDETKILDKEDNWNKSNISEMYHITNNNTVNFRTDTNNLNSTYNEILKFNYHNKTRNRGYNNNKDI
ncbi:hypothetical protein M0804_000972 [Polistes exclamans]|nr:hypothetical protein M0804_000972 [Polistes exclamans]